MSKKIMKVLILNENAEKLCEKHRALGHEAYYLANKGNYSEWQILGNVSDILKPKDHLGDFETPVQYISFKTADGHYHEVDEWDMIIGR